MHLKHCSHGWDVHAQYHDCNTSRITLVQIVRPPSNPSCLGVGSSSLVWLVLPVTKWLLAQYHASVLQDLVSYPPNNPTWPTWPKRCRMSTMIVSLSDQWWYWQLFCTILQSNNDLATLRAGSLRKRRLFQPLPPITEWLWQKENYRPFLSNFLQKRCKTSRVCS